MAAMGGLLTGIFGLGGGMVMVPYFNIIEELPQMTAVATSLFAIIPSGVIGTFQNAKLGRVHFKYSLAMAASSTSGVNELRFGGADYAPTADFGLFQKAVEAAKAKNIPIKAGNVLSSDEFYADEFESYKKWSKFGVLCVEMEAAGLYTVAAKHNANALAILTISDSLVTGERTTSKERETTFKAMIKIALELA